MLALLFVPTVVGQTQEKPPVANSAELRAVLADINRDLQALAADYKVTAVALNNDLAELTAQAAGTTTTCGRFEAEVEEFLYRLSRGERKDSILQEATNVGQSLGMGPATRKAVLEYLAGAETDDAFAATIAASKNDIEFCRASLYGLWYSELTKNRSQGTRYHLALARNGHRCRVELTYAKKFSATPSTEPRPTAPRSR